MMERVHARTVSGTDRGRLRRTVLATAAGLALLSGAAVSVPSAQAAATGSPAASAVSHAVAEPCPCINPICRPGCSQD